jgi:hypothetical protein
MILGLQILMASLELSEVQGIEERQELMVSLQKLLKLVDGALLVCLRR